MSHDEATAERTRRILSQHGDVEASEEHGANDRTR